jgi:hypothetical protein
LSRGSEMPGLPSRLSVEHKDMAKSEAYAVGYLATKIYGFDMQSLLFTHIFKGTLLSRFWQVPQALTDHNVYKKITVSEAVKTLKGSPWNLPWPSDYFRYPSTT